MGMSTFGTFTMARLGIYVSQQALNVTGNNISNINTEGYSRQALDQKAMTSGGADRYVSKLTVRENGGVLSTGVNQLRDKYLDIRYRNEMTKSGEMDAKLKGLNDLASIFDEVAREDGDGVLEARFNDLIQQIENLHQPMNVGDDGSDSLVRQAAEALAVQFNDYAKKLDTLAANIETEFNDQVTSVNAILTKIRDLNTSIRKSDVFGSNALAQRDERNLLIDELAEKVGINVVYEMEKLGDDREVEKLVIKTSGIPERTLVDGIYAGQLSIAKTSTGTQRTDAEGNPVTDNGVAVYDWERGQSEYFDLVISPLEDEKGLRDPAQPNEPETTYLVQSVGTDSSDWDEIEDQVRRLHFASAEEAKAYEDALNEQYGLSKRDDSPRTTPYFHIADDELSDAEREEGAYIVHYHTIVDGEDSYNFINVTSFEGTVLGDTELSGGLQAMRELLTEEGEYADQADLLRDPEAGTKRGIPYYRQALDTLAREFAKQMNAANTLSDDVIYEKDGGEFVLDADGKKILKAEYSYYNGGALFTDRGDSAGKVTADASNITAANISIAYDWSHGSTRMLRTREPITMEQSTRQDNLTHFVNLLTSDQTFVFGVADEGISYFTGTFQEMLTDTIAGTLAKDQSITESMLNNYNATADELYVDRDAVMGVDLNDEAMNMMMFQKAYSAACRLMTTYDGMLDKLINGTAV